MKIKGAVKGLENDRRGRPRDRCHQALRKPRGSDGHCKEICFVTC